jgi:hypothetical protein
MKSGLLATALCVLVLPGAAFSAEPAPQRPSIPVPQVPSPLVKPSPVPRVVAPLLIGFGESESLAITKGDFRGLPAGAVQCGNRDESHQWDGLGVSAFSLPYHQGDRSMGRCGRFDGALLQPDEALQDRRSGLPEIANASEVGAHLRLPVVPGPESWPLSEPPPGRFR